MRKVDNNKLRKVNAGEFRIYFGGKTGYVLGGEEKFADFGRGSRVGFESDLLTLWFDITGYGFEFMFGIGKDAFALHINHELKQFYISINNNVILDTFTATVN